MVYTLIWPLVHNFGLSLITLALAPTSTFWPWPQGQEFGMWPWGQSFDLTWLQ